MDYSLDPPAKKKAEILSRVGQRVIEFLDDVPDQPAQATENSQEAHGWVEEPPPEDGTSLDTILELLFDKVIPCAFNTASPGYLAYVPGGGLYSSAVADFLASAVNRYSGVWDASPGAVELETQVLRWLVELMGFPRDSSLGVFTTGGSLSNLIALVAAREALLGTKIIQGTAYFSTETHHTVMKAARIAGIPEENFRFIPVDNQFKMKVDHLEESIDRDKKQGRIPFFICASAGTVNTGTVDPLNAIADVSEKHGMWFHIDGAYGAVFNLLPQCQKILAGMGRANSLALDPHKGFFLAYGCGVLLTRDVAPLRNAYSRFAAYMPGMQDGREVDFCEISPELSRAWRGLRLWLPFKLHGIATFRSELERKRDLAVDAWRRLSSQGDVEIAAPPELSLFAFRQRYPQVDLEEENRRNRELLERINKPRRIMVTGTEIQGKFYTRICVLHLRTDRARMEEGMEIIFRALEEGRG